MPSGAAERYVRLGLQLGRHVDGIVDAYFGPPEMAAAVEAEPLVDPRELISAADLLVDELGDGWLRDQVIGVRSYAAGWRVSRARTPTRSRGATASGRPQPTKPCSPLPTSGSRRCCRVDQPLVERYRRWQDSILVPTERVERTVAAVIEAARAWTRAQIGLPDGEEVVLEIVRDRPWLAFCEYLGDLRSRIAVNLDLPLSAVELLRLAIHETYPGHHTERAWKDHLLVRGRGLLEETLVLVPTPQSLVSEGIAELAPTVLLEGDGGAALAAVVREAGIGLDLDHALAVERALEPCRWAEVNAALMLHETGSSEAEVHAYLRRWGLMTPKLAAHLIRFLQEPSSRTYPITYPAGRELCRSYAAGESTRFRCLLTRAGAHPRSGRSTGPRPGDG